MFSCIWVMTWHVVCIITPCWHMIWTLPWAANHSSPVQLVDYISELGGISYGEALANGTNDCAHASCLQPGSGKIWFGNDSDSENLQIEIHHRFKLPVFASKAFNQGRGRFGLWCSCTRKASERIIVRKWMSCAYPPVIGLNSLALCENDFGGLLKTSFFLNISKWTAPRSWPKPREAIISLQLWHLWMESVKHELQLGNSK